MSAAGTAPSLPPVALTCGEPAGVGPELALAARARLGIELPFFLIADRAHMAALAKRLDAPVPVVEIADPAEAADALAHGLPLLHHAFPAPASPGRPDPRNADEVIGVIARAAALVQAGRAGALCTGPIHKAALKQGAGFPHPGHTEFLAHLAGTGRAVMMLTAEGCTPPLRVVPVTIHLSLSAVPGALDAALLEDTLRIVHDALVRDFGIARPRLAVAGLNPHAGEEGVMGDEEQRLIAPVLDALRAEGLALAGPLPADTLFHAEARAAYDAAICMYHDQALIPLKTLDFHGGVNVTLGLPFIRTSPDHGTALDIAGTGRARPDSLIAALRQAWRMACARRGAGR